MRRFFLIWLLLFSFLSAGYVHWFGDYDKALALAHKEDKYLLVLLVKDDCQSCNNLIRDVFINQPYVDMIDKNFISVIVTYEGVTSYPIEMYYSTVFPTLFLVDTQTELFLSEPLMDDIGKDRVEKIIKDIVDKR